VDAWLGYISFSLISAVMFVFATTAIVAQFGDIARFPGWSRACVLPRAATTTGRVLNSLTYAVVGPLTPLMAVAVIGEGLRLQNPVLVALGLLAVVAIAGWIVFLLRGARA
jgi:hypothetical protein